MYFWYADHGLQNRLDNISRQHSLDRGLHVGHFKEHGNLWQGYDYEKQKTSWLGNEHTYCVQANDSYFPRIAAWITFARNRERMNSTLFQAYSIIIQSRS